MTAESLRKELVMSRAEWRCVMDAARDAHMHPIAYCRLMVLAAAGMGGVKEHIERAIDASFEVDEAPGIKATCVNARQHRKAR